MYPFIINGHLTGAFFLLLLWTVLLWTWVYKYIFEIQLSILVATEPETIAGSYDNSLFNFLRNLPTVLQSVPFYTPKFLTWNYSK